MTTKEDIQKVLWNAAGSFRGKIDSGKYKDYILSMLFVKYLSDAIKETKEELIKKYNAIYIAGRFLTASKPASSWMYSAQ